MAAKLNKSTHTLYEWLYRNDLKMSQLRNVLLGSSNIEITESAMLEGYKYDQEKIYKARGF